MNEAELSYENEDTQKNKYLVFSLGDENYGIPIRYVIEIINLIEITAVPEQPEYIKGIINLRGKVISVMDVRLRFLKEEKEHDDRTCIIVVQVEDQLMGLIVDLVNEVASIEEQNISQAPALNPSDSATGFIEEIGKIDNKILLLVDCKKLLKS